MVNYYVDFVNGKNSNGGQGPSPNAALTLNRPVKSLHYMVGSSNALLPGDKIYISGGQTWTMGGGGMSGNADLSFLLDGSTNGQCITVTGCYPGGTNQNKPKINFGALAYGGWMQDDNYWRLNNIIFRRSTKNTYGVFRAGNSYISNNLEIDFCEFSGNSATTNPLGLYIAYFNNVRISSCNFHGNNRGSTTNYGGLYATNLTNCDLIDCRFSSNYNYNLYILTSWSFNAYNCKFLAGDGTYTRYGVHLEQFANVNLFNCTSNCNTQSVRYNNYTNVANCNRCSFLKLPAFVTNTPTAFSSACLGRISLENCICGGVPTNTCINLLGTHSKNTSVYNGTTSSIFISTNSITKWTFPFIYINSDPSIADGGFKSWYTYSSSPRTLTCYVYASGSKNMSDGLPKASSLYLRSRYYDSTTGKFLLTPKSTENPQLNTWTAITNTIPSTVDGYIYSNVFLHKRMPSANARLAIGKGVYIDPKVTLS